MHPDQQTAQFIRNRRIELGMSQRKLARMISLEVRSPISRDYIQRIEYNGQTISPYLLPSISKVLKVSIVQLIRPPGKN